MNAAPEVCALLSLLIRAMVADRDAVQVTSFQHSQSTVFQVTVGKDDRGKLIGQQGRIARSLRLLLTCIARENGGAYSLVLE